jgi:hypothetical protein
MKGIFCFSLRYNTLLIRRYNILLILEKIKNKVVIFIPSHGFFWVFFAFDLISCYEFKRLILFIFLFFYIILLFILLFLNLFMSHDLLHVFLYKFF